MDGQKLLALSDTHGDIYALKAVFEWAQNRKQDERITATAFLGDGALDLQRAAAATGFFCNWKLVRGNNDYDSDLPDTAVFDFGGHRFFLCHGHRHALYNGYHAIIAAARKSEADAALFGHAHVPYHKTVNGITLINPGSIGMPRSRAGSTFAVIDCAARKPLEVVFWEIGSTGKIRELKAARG
ncbi:MAG: metallophosphoesterase [Treponema sp.]|nr:metallophosphoesterase [Treponema sp.]